MTRSRRSPGCWLALDLRRDGGYFEAGEYVCSLSGPDGDVGGSQKLTLTGDNPPVYRGAMDFASGDSGKKKKNSNIQSVSSGLDGGQQVASNDDNGSAAPVSTDVAPEGNGGSMVPDSAYNKTSEEEAVQGHPSGCGCVAAGSGTAVGLLSLPLAGAVVLVLARRRRDKRDRA